MASTASAATWPLPSAAERASSASWLACCALPAFSFTVTESWRMAAAISSRLATCSSVRADRSVAPLLSLAVLALMAAMLSVA